MRRIDLPKPGQTMVHARGLCQHTPLRSTYQNVDLDIARGSLCSIVAEDRRGKTELLLTLAGRMRHSTGKLFVAGLELPGHAREVRGISGMGFIPGVNDVQPLLSLRTVVSAELNLHQRRSGRDATAEYLERWSFDGRGAQKTESLDRFDMVRFGIALGMAGDPALLVVDDVEADLTAAQSAAILDELAGLAHERGTTVVVACTDALLARRADAAVPISEAARAQMGMTDKELAYA